MWSVLAPMRTSNLRIVLAIVSIMLLLSGIILYLVAYTLKQLNSLYTDVTHNHSDLYPLSEDPGAEAMMDELINKLAEKDFDTAEYYFRRRAFHSANIYYEGVATDYPQTAWAPRALLRLHESYTRLGYEQEAEAAKQRLLREFPSSPQAQQVDGNGVTADSRP